MRKLLLLGLIAILIVAGCTSQTEYQTGASIADQEQTTTQEPKIVCNPPYMRKGEVCCLDQNNNSICDIEEPKPNCPHECCVDNNYKPKDCSYNEECINNICVKKACPYECCDETTYQVKFCSLEYECVNNKCEEIKAPKLSLIIDACNTGFNIIEELFEVTDVYATVTNYGTKEALYVKITSTANDATSIYRKSKGTISSLPANSSQKFKVTVDTKEGIPTEVSVTAGCDECSPKSITATNPDCHVDYEGIINEIQKWIEIGGKVVPFSG